MSAAPSSRATTLRLLVDSNFVITLEPYAGKLEPGQPAAAEVVRLATEQGHKLFVHPATRDDLLQANDPILRAQRLAELQKFPQLSEGKIPGTLTTSLGTPADGGNDHRDLRLLAALHNKAVAYLITDDAGLRKRARRVGLDERVLTLNDAVELLRQLAPALLTPPPRVVVLPPYALDGDQKIFDSLRDDYPEFDTWLHTKVRPDIDNRDCLIIEQNGRYAALAVVKRTETDCPYSLVQPVTKLATFKVHSDFLGSKYGELLLKSIFATAHERDVFSLYVEVLAKHEALLALLERFGFQDSGHRTSRDELVYVKTLRAEPDHGLSPLEYHVRYGPPAIAGTGRVFVVPIQPRWHQQLFPDAPPEMSRGTQQLELISEPELGTHPWGNALRKAYLCNSPSKKIAAGDTLLFYRSGGPSNVVAVGVVEDRLRSPDADEVLTFVAGRTVYRPDEIATMAACVGGVLAILFRQDRFIDPPWSLAELQANGVVSTWPQSITQVRPGGAQWVQDRLTESP